MIRLSYFIHIQYNFQRKLSHTTHVVHQGLSQNLAHGLHGALEDLRPPNTWTASETLFDKYNIKGLKKVRWRPFCVRNV